VINVFATPPTCGASDNPCVITTPAELAAIADNLDYYYVLGNNIDMTDVEWIPIGDYIDPFVGVLNGAGYSISHLSSSTVWVDYSYVMAMFGYVDESAEIYNLGLNIDYVYDSSSSGENILVGGLVGAVDSLDVSIHDIWVSGSIDVTTDDGDEWASVGGLIGEAYNHIIYGISFTGEITFDIGAETLADLFVGGILGYCEDTSLTQSTVYDSTITIDSYNNGYVGGLVGAEDINEIWFSDGGYDIIGHSVVDNLEINSLGDSKVGGLVGYVYNDSGEYIWIEDNWVKNSSFSDGMSYTGSIAGYADGITIRQNQVESVTIGSDTNATGYLGGLVGYGSFLNVDRNRIVDLIILAGEESQAIGGLVGYLQYSNVDHTYVTGNLQSNSGGVGGIVGEANELAISNTYFSGILSGVSSVGGLVGESSFILEITSSWTDGDFSATDDCVGGLIGYSGGNESTINDSYSLASISGTSYVGGLIGAIVASFTTIERCYFGGIVSAENNYDGLIGYYSGDSVSPDYLYYNEVNGPSSYGTAVPTSDFKSATSEVGIEFEAFDFKSNIGEMPTWFVTSLFNDGYLSVFAERELIVFVDQESLAGLIMSWGEIYSMEESVLYKMTPSYQTGINPNVDYTIYWGLKAIEPVDPKKADYVFGGWYTEPEFTNLWDFSDSSEVDLTLYAKWTAGVPNTGDLFGLSNALMGLGGLLIMATKRRRI